MHKLNHISQQDPDEAVDPDGLQPHADACLCETEVHEAVGDEGLATVRGQPAEVNPCNLTDATSASPGARRRCQSPPEVSVKMQADRPSPNGGAASGGGGPLTGTLDSDSHGAWVDTVTMWSNVQRHGEELQRRRLEQMPTMSCAGVGWCRGPRRFLQRIRTQLIVMARVAAKDPYTVVVPMFVLICMLAFGLWGVFSVSYAIRNGRRQAALNAAVDFSNTLKSHISATMAPASTVKTLIELDPQWGSINSTFHEVAPSLVQKGRESDAILTIVLAPQGIVQAIVPTGLPAWNQVYGLDLLQNKSWRGDALKTVMLHNEGMVMTGPSRLRAGMMGIVTRYAVFIKGRGPNETFGAPGLSYNCSPCYEAPTPTSPSQRFWGFAQLNVDWEVLIRNITHMYDLCERDNLHFNMTYIDPVSHVNRSIAACGAVGPEPVFVNITTMQNHWILAVADARGWVPDWLPLVLAVVVLVSLWVSCAMAVILINRREHMWLLQAMLPKKVIATLRRGEEYAEAFECVTVLFSDIVSYTTLASELEPIKVVRLLNEMYSAFDTLVDRYDCYKVETIGDAFMAVCGTQGEDAVCAAVKMARLAQAMVERTRVLVSADGQKIQIRIGLHSGPVVGAVVGFKMPHFCLCGDTVNTASRMESNSKPMRIHLSDTTAQLLLASGAGFQLERRGPIEVKGKGSMLTHWLIPEGGSCKATAAAAEEAAEAAGTQVEAAQGADREMAAVGAAAPKSAPVLEGAAAAGDATWGPAAGGMGHVSASGALYGAAASGGPGGGLSINGRRHNSEWGGATDLPSTHRGLHFFTHHFSGQDGGGGSNGGGGSGGGGSKKARASADLRLFQHGSNSRGRS